VSSSDDFTETASLHREEQVTSPATYCCSDRLYPSGIRGVVGQLRRATSLPRTGGWLLERAIPEGGLATPSAVTRSSRAATEPALRRSRRAGGRIISVVRRSRSIGPLQPEDLKRLFPDLAARTRNTTWWKCGGRDHTPPPEMPARRSVESARGPSGRRPPGFRSSGFRFIVVSSNGTRFPASRRFRTRPSSDSCSFRLVSCAPRRGDHCRSAALVRSWERRIRSRSGARPDGYRFGAAYAIPTALEYFTGRVAFAI
jgi:hypothetical protein